MHRLPDRFPMGAGGGHGGIAGVAAAAAVGARGEATPGPRALHPAPREETEIEVRERKDRCSGTVKISSTIMGFFTLI